MNRSINNAVESVFNQVQLKFDLLNSEHLPSDFYRDRYIAGDSKDIEWLKRSNIIEKVEIGHGSFFVILDFESSNYFITIGGERSESSISGFTPIEINAGIFVALVHEVEISLKTDISLEYLEEHILSQHTKTELYKGHDFKDLLKIFPSIDIYEITPQYLGDNTNLFQAIAHYLTTTGNFLTLPFSEETLTSINELALIGSEILNYESIVQSLTSSSWKFAFLDLYRCVEMLYQLIYVDEVYDHLGLTIDKTAFLDSVDSKLKWRPTERNSITKLLKDTPEFDKENLINELKKINSSISSIADWIYDLRCKIVHLKRIQSGVELKSRNWDGIIKGMSSILIFWYNKYKVY